MRRDLVTLLLRLTAQKRIGRIDPNDTLTVVGLNKPFDCRERGKSGTAKQIETIIQASTSPPPKYPSSPVNPLDLATIGHSIPLLPVNFHHEVHRLHREKEKTGQSLCSL
jgi:hypothetical protein